MFILSLFLVLALLQVGKDVSEEGMAICFYPRFWVQLTSLLLIAFVSTL